MSCFLFETDYIITPQNTITPHCITEIKYFLRKSERAVIDMKNVAVFSNAVLKFLCDYKEYLTLINTDSSLLFLIYTLGIDKQLKIFEDEISFFENKNELINRRLFAL